MKITGFSQNKQVSGKLQIITNFQKRAFYHLVYLWEISPKSCFSSQILYWSVVFKGKLCILIKLLEIYWFYWNYWKIPILSLECCPVWCICMKNKVFNENLQIYQIFQYIAIPFDVLHWKITEIFKIIRIWWKIYHFKALFMSNAMK